MMDYGARLKPGERAPSAYAASASASRGRQFAEPECPTRSSFQRDRDRILHTSAFRRLTHKTQVFLLDEGDHFRCRLTHSLEVAQIARAVSRQLLLDEDLAEGLALAHDLGHPPFGHAGERALDAAMRDIGGFDHNAQSVRVVTRLERRYAAFDGLNLTWEALEGLAKHNGPVAAGSAMAKAVRGLERWRSLDLALCASAEAQVAALADDIAYGSHDVDDGLRAGLIGLDDLTAAPLVAGIAREVAAIGKELHETRASHEVIRRMIAAMVRDLVAQSRRRLRQLAPVTADDIRRAGAPVAAFSAAMARDIAGLKRFLFDRVYRAPRVARVMADAEAIVADLFSRYMHEPRQMPPSWRTAALKLEGAARARHIADFVAGMTDRYAIAEHRRLFDATPELR